MTMQDGIRAVQQAFAQRIARRRGGRCTCARRSSSSRSRIEGFDERRYGFSSVVDLLRAAAKEGVLKLERDRHGAFRVFAGSKLTAPQPRVEVEEPAFDAAGEIIAEQPAVEEGESIQEPPIVDVQPIETAEPIGVAAAESEAVVDDVSADVGQPGRKGARKRKTAPRAKAAKGDSRKADKPSRPRARKSNRTKAEAADR